MNQIVVYKLSVSDLEKYNYNVDIIENMFSKLDIFPVFRHSFKKYIYYNMFYDRYIIVDNDVDDDYVILKHLNREHDTEYDDYVIYEQCPQLYLGNLFERLTPNNQKYITNLIHKRDRIPPTQEDELDEDLLNYTPTTSNDETFLIHLRINESPNIKFLNIKPSDTFHDLYKQFRLKVLLDYRKSNYDIYLWNRPKYELSSWDTPLQPNGLYLLKLKSNEQTKERENSMVSKTQVQVNKNVEAAKMAAQLELGNIVLNKANSLVADKAPLMMRGYIKAYPGVTKLIIANIISFAIDQYTPTTNRGMMLKDRGEYAAEAAMNAAMVEMVKSFNVEELLEKMIAELPSDLFTEKEEKESK